MDYFFNVNFSICFTPVQNLSLNSLIKNAKTDDSEHSELKSVETIYCTDPKRFIPIYGRGGRWFEVRSCLTKVN